MRLLSCYLATCLVLAVSAKPTVEDVLVGLKGGVTAGLGAIIDAGNPTRTVVGGCGFEMRVPAHCVYQLAPFSNATDGDCSFLQIGKPLLADELIAVASGECKNSVNVGMLVKDSEEVAWKIGVFRDEKTVGATGYMRELTLQDVVQGAFDGLGYKLEDLKVPGKIQNVTLTAAHQNATQSTWLDFGGSDGNGSVEVITITSKTNKSSGAAVKASFTNQHLSSFLDRFGGGSLELDFLENSAYSIVVATRNITAADAKKYLPNSGQKFTTIERGLAMSATLNKPKECRSQFCKFLGSILQDDKPLTIQGQIGGQKDFSLSASIPFDIALGTNGKMKDLMLSVATSPKQVAVQLNFEILNPSLLLTGGIQAGVSGLGLQASMKGMWENAFGLPFVAFGNLNLAVNFVPPNPVPSAFEIGGSLMLGYKPTKADDPDMRIMAAAYVGINTAEPTQNYFYGSLELSVGRMLEAFNVKAELPDIVAETGFPNGVVASYTSNPKGKKIPSIGISVPFGLYLKGDLTVMGLTSKCLVEYKAKPEPSIFLNVTLPILRLGGVATFKASEHREEGAHALLKFSSANPMDTVINFQGYLEVLGMYRYASMDVNKEHFRVTTGGGLLQFEAEMSIQAEYGNIETASFSMNASLKNNDKLKDLTKTLEKKLTERLKEGKKELRKAQEELKRAKADCQKKLTLKCNDCAGAQNAICDNMAVKPCRAGCELAFWNKSGCRKKCDKAGRDCKRDINKACAGSCGAIDTVGQGLCQTVVVAQATVTATEQTYGGIVKVTIEGLKGLELFDIRLLQFSTELTAKLKFDFDCQIELVVLKKNFSVQYNLNLELLSEGNKAAVEKLFASIYDHVKNKFS